MLGCRPLTDLELAALVNKLPSPRDRALVWVLTYAGLRISEALPLQLKHIQRGYLLVTASKAKGGRSRSVLINRQLVARLTEYIQEAGLTNPETYLFAAVHGSRKGLPMSRIAAHYVVTQAATQAGLSGKVATHSFRKTFAAKVWELSGKDLVQTQKALGHTSIDSTAKYLAVDQGVADRLVADITFA